MVEGSIRGTFFTFPVSTQAMGRSFFVIVLLTARASLACSCVGYSTACQGIGSGHIVFVGEVLDVPVFVDRAGPEIRLVRFRVERLFKGLPPGTAIVDVDNFAGTTCQATFVKGRQYLVHAGRRESGEIMSGFCSNTKELQYATEDLDVLDGWEPGKSVATIQGEVFPNLLHGARVTAMGNDGKHYDATAGADGRFQISRVPAGHYRLRAEQAGLRFSGSPVEVKIGEGECHEVRLWMFFMERQYAP